MEKTGASLMERNPGFHWPTPALKWGARLSVKHRKQDLRIVAALVKKIRPSLFDMAFEPRSEFSCALKCSVSPKNPVVERIAYGMD